MTSKLSLADIVDLRAYENERDTLRPQMIELKKTRRVHLGDIVTLTFENRETIRYQIQEMARAERMLRDDQIQQELDTYNALVPEPNQLSATLFIELTSKDELMKWLPKLVGIERSIELQVGDEVIKATPEAEHDEHLTREAITASVHFVHFSLTDEQAEAFASAPVTVRVAHPAYRMEAELRPDTRGSLLNDLTQ